MWEKDGSVEFLSPLLPSEIQKIIDLGTGDEIPNHFAIRYIGNDGSVKIQVPTGEIPGYYRDATEEEFARYNPLFDQQKKKAGIK